MFSLVRLMSAPYFRRHWLRTLLTTGGIVLGVAVFFAIRTANDSLRRAFHETVDRVAGKAQLQITGGEAGFPESVLQDVVAVPGVQAAAPVVEAIVRPRLLSEGSLMILGVDLTGDRTVREYEMEGQENAIEDPLVFMAQPDSICLSRDLADRHNLKLGDTLELQTAVGAKTFRIRGLLEPKGTASAFGGSIAVMDIYAAQFVFNRGERFDRLDVVVAPDREPEEIQARLQERLGIGYKVEPPARRSERMQGLTEGFASALSMTSLVALVVGVFLIFNTFAVSVMQRRRDIGILRALGATRHQIQGMILVESVLMGVAGSAVGIFLGYLAASQLLGFMDRMVTSVYGIATNTHSLRLSPTDITLAVLAGVLAALAGAFFPARAATRVNPSLALQKGRYQVLMLGENRKRNSVGIVLTAIGLILFFGPWRLPRWGEYASLVFSVLGLSMFVPLLSHGLAMMLRRPMGQLFGVEGLLASDSLIQAPRRTSATVAALLFSLSFVVSSILFNQSFRNSLVTWMEQVVNPDLVVNSSASITEHLYRFPPALADRLKAVPGIRQVDCVRTARVDFGNDKIMLISIEIDQFYRRARQIVVQGEDREIQRRLISEDVIALSDNLAVLYGLNVGDRLTLETPSGSIEFPIVGVVRDFSSEKGSIFMDRDVYVRFWKDESVDMFDLMIDPGLDPGLARQRVLETLADQGRVFVLTREEFWADVMRLIDRFFLLSYVQILVAIFVAVLGIVNTLFVSISDRTREIGVFRAVGGGAGQVRKMILLEASAIALISSLLGILGGAYLGYFINTSLTVNQYGWYIPYLFPWAQTGAMVLMIIVVAIAAAWIPAVVATRQRLAEALAYE